MTYIRFVLNVTIFNQILLAYYEKQRMHGSRLPELLIEKIIHVVKSYFKKY